MDESVQSGGTGRPEQVSKLFYRHLELLKTQNMDKWVHLWADDAVIEFPYAPAGSTSRLEGKSAIKDFFMDSSKYVNFLAWTDLQIYPMLAPDTIFVEFRSEAEVVGKDRSYNQVYCGFLQVKDGLIVFYREYWNPMIVLEAFGNADAPK